MGFADTRVEFEQRLSFLKILLIDSNEKGLVAALLVSVARQQLNKLIAPSMRSHLKYITSNISLILLSHLLPHVSTRAAFNIHTRAQSEECFNEAEGAILFDGSSECSIDLLVAKFLKFRF